MSVGAGTDVAMEAADIVLIKSDLRDVLLALDVSRATMPEFRVGPQLQCDWPSSHRWCRLPGRADAPPARTGRTGHGDVRPCEFSAA